MTPLTGLRPARPGDAAQLARILQDWVEETEWMPALYSPTQTQAFLEQLISGGSVTVAEDQSKLCGFLALDQTEIIALYIAKSARGQGWGTALLDHAKAAHHHLALWTFAQNAPARAFYSGRGFRQTKASDGSRNDENLPDIRMEWSTHG